MAMSRVFSASDPQCLFIDNTPSNLLVSTRLVGLRSKTSLAYAGNTLDHDDYRFQPTRHTAIRHYSATAGG